MPTGSGAHWGRNSLNIAPLKKTLTFRLIPPIPVQHIKVFSDLPSFHVFKYLLQQWESRLSLFSILCWLSQSIFYSIIVSISQSHCLLHPPSTCNPPSLSCIFWCQCSPHWWVSSWLPFPALHSVSLGTDSDVPLHNIPFTSDYPAQGRSWNGKP